MDSSSYPTRIFILMSVVIFTFVLQAQVKASLIYVDKEETWMDAKSFCSSTYDGHLVTMDSIEGDLVSCIPNGRSVWTGNFTVVTEWITIDGCYDYKLRDSPFVTNFTLERPSVFRCAQKCFEEPSSRTLAIQGHNCVCDFLADTNSAKIDAAKCNTKCDDAGYCGGDGGFTVYSIKKLDNIDTSDEGLCVTYECSSVSVIGRDNRIKLKSANCSNTERYICENNNDDGFNKESDNKVNWTTALANCASNYHFFLASDVGKEACPTLLYSYIFWIGIFKAEGLLIDPDFTDTPYRIIKVTMSNDGITTNRVLYSAEERSTFICRTEKESITLEDGNTLCNESSTSTHGSTTPGGSTDPTYTSNSQMSAITTTSSQTMSEFTSTTPGSSTGSASLQITGNSSKSVVIPVVGAVCGLIFAGAIGLLAFFLKRRYKKRLERKSRQGNTSVMYVNDFNGASRSNQNGSGGDENDLETGPVYQNCKKWPGKRDQACALENKDAAHELMESQPNSDSDKRGRAVYRVLDKNCVYSIVKKPAKNSEDPEYMETMDDDYDVLHDSSKRRVESAGTDHVYGHVKDQTWNTVADYDVCTSKTNNVEGECGHVPTGANETDDDLYDHSDRGFKKDLESDYDTMNLQR